MFMSFGSNYILRMWGFVLADYGKFIYGRQAGRTRIDAAKRYC